MSSVNLLFKPTKLHRIAFSEDCVAFHFAEGIVAFTAHETEWQRVFFARPARHNFGKYDERVPEGFSLPYGDQGAHTMLFFRTANGTGYSIASTAVPLDLETALTFHFDCNWLPLGKKADAMPAQLGLDGSIYAE